MSNFSNIKAHEFSVRVVRRAIFGGVSALTICAPVALSEDRGFKDELPINYMQLIGSHNSYKLYMDAAIAKEVYKVSPKQAAALHYNHESLTAQLERGLRNLEIDVLYDDEGGRYAHPAGLENVDLSENAFDPKPLLPKGYKVLHVQDIDFRSSCPTLSACLEEIKNWSDANSTHLPIFITMNIKQGPSPMEGGTLALPFTPEAATVLDDELLTYMGLSKILVPDDVRGDSPSLASAVKDKGWPALGEARGKFVFILDAKKPTRDVYLQGHPSLSNRIAFANFPVDHEAAAILIVNDPIKDQALIKTYTQEGFIVRTRADANTVEARSNDTRRRDAAFKSGAQIISTDYYTGETPFSTGYHVVFPSGGYSRISPYVENLPKED